MRTVVVGLLGILLSVTSAFADGNGKVWLSYNAASYLRVRHDIKDRDDLIKNLDGALDAMTNKALE